MSQGKSDLRKAVNTMIAPNEEYLYRPEGEAWKSYGLGVPSYLGSQ